MSPLVHSLPGMFCFVLFWYEGRIDLLCNAQNHSCDPNVFINAVYVNDADFNKPLFCMFTKRQIKPFEELAFSYYGQDDSVRQSHFRNVYDLTIA